VYDEHEQRVVHAAGKGYPDLVRLRAGQPDGAPDAIAYPADHDQVSAVLELCARSSVAVVPFGGGTSVVGGLEAQREGFAGIVSLDLGRMDALESIDERSLTAVFAPGIRLPEAERALGARGLRLAHVPQSFEWATVGGCVATRSAGQSSTGNGRIDENVVALRCATPAGELATLGAPGSAAGPALRELVVGSEGALGVITRVALRVRPVPGAERHEGWFARTFADGCEALRRLEQEGLAPDVARLSDETETRVALALAGPGGAARRAGAAATRALGYGEGCLVVLGWEARDERAIGARRRPAAGLLRKAGLLYVGKGPGEAWAATRFAGPHLRDDLLDRGALVETLETATSWSRLEALRDAVARALEGALGRALVGCHVSHLYPTGASLYFTILAAQSADPAGQWRALKSRAVDAIATAGGTLTHHHAIGHDHAPWLAGEIGDFGVNLLRTLKSHCDPAGIMNPGKVL